MQPIDMTPHFQRDAEVAAINAERRRKYEEDCKRRNDELRKAANASNWRTQMNAYERKLGELKYWLRHLPQDEAIREEHDRVEAAYKELRDEYSA